MSKNVSRMRQSTVVGLSLVSALGLFLTAEAQAETAEIYCTIRDANSRLNCLWVEKGNKRKMTSGDISEFIDQSQVAAYITVRSRAGFERVFMVDPNAMQFHHLNDVKANSSISDVSKAKSELFTEIESRTIALSDEFDNRAKTSELVLSDPSIAVDQAKLKDRDLVKEVESCHSTSAEQGETAPAPAETKVMTTNYGNSRHKVTFTKSFVDQTGTFTQNSSMLYKSVDDMAFELQYRYNLEKWVLEAELQHYSVYSNYNKGSTGGTVNYAGTDSTATVTNLWLRGNRCFGMWSGAQVCPGIDAGYDTYAVMGFNTLNVTGSNPNATSTIGLQALPDVSVGVNAKLNFAIGRRWMLFERVGYEYGTGALGGGPTSVKNRAYYLDSVAEFPFAPNFAFQFGLTLLQRTSSANYTAANNTNITVGVDNPSITMIDWKAGLSWNFGTGL